MPVTRSIACSSWSVLRHIYPRFRYWRTEFSNLLCHHCCLQESKFRPSPTQDVMLLFSPEPQSCSTALRVCPLAVPTSQITTGLCRAAIAKSRLRYDGRGLNFFMWSRATCKTQTPQNVLVLSWRHAVRINKVWTHLNPQRTDLPDQVHVSGLQPGSYIFQLTVTDSNHQSDAANVSVLVLSPELSSCECSWEMERFN